MRLTFALGLSVAGILALMVLPVVAADSAAPAATATSAAPAKAPAKAPVAPAAPARAVPLYTKDKPPATPKLDDLPLKESLTQNGITWTFDKPVHVGQFITGDYYVVGAVTVKAIDPKPLFGDEVKDPLPTEVKLYKDQYARNGSTLNLPGLGPPDKVTRRSDLSGLDSRISDNCYDAKQFTRLPITLKPGDSLLSSISHDKMVSTSAIKALAVLTCLAEPQPADAFRPSFCQTATSKVYLARNLRRDLLLKLPKPASAAVSPSAYAHNFTQTLWVDTVGFGRAMPRLSFSYDGAGVAVVGGSGSLLLLLDYPPEEKEPLLLGMTQVGIDLYGLVRGGWSWPAEGICGSGRKWLIVFAGLMVDDPEMAAVSKTYSQAEFQEDEQTVFLPVEYEGKKFEKTTLGAKVCWTGHYGIRHGRWASKWASGYGPTDLFPPSEWVSPWPRGEADRRGTSSPQWVGEALAARLMHAEKTWDHDAWFAYVDRWMTEDDTKFIEEVKRVWDEKLAKATTDAEKKALQADARAKWTPPHEGTVGGPRDLPNLAKDLWAKYRNNLPPAADGTKTPPAETTWK